MDLTTMSYEVGDGVAHVRFNRPEGANAVNPAFSADLRAVTLAVEFDDAVKAVSVTAEGKVFCAGGDLKLFHEAGDRLPNLAADMLVELVGPELGLLDQELAKMALSTGADGQITPEIVQRMVGSWRAKTVWVMLDAAMDGNVPDAMGQLDRLLMAGEMPIAILGQISASLRRMAAATRLILKTEAAGRRPALGPALEQAGVKRFVLEKAQRQLRLLGRNRGAMLYRWLLQAD